MKKLFLIILTYLFMLAPGHAMEFGVDRPGGDYKGFNIDNNPSICRAHCRNEGRCKAWTFVRPGHQGTSARCWLKNKVPAAKNSPCCVSGVKKKPSSSIEYGVDRAGRDYKNFNVENNPLICRNRCLNENRCKAWTFVRPGHQGVSARCWLKTGVPAKRDDSCCVSGVKK